MGPRTNLQVLLTWSRIRASLSEVCVRGVRWLHVANTPSFTSTSRALLSANPDQGSQKARWCTYRTTTLYTNAPTCSPDPDTDTSHLVFSSNSFEKVCSRMLESKALLCRITAFKCDWNKRWKKVFGANPKPIEARIFSETAKSRTSETTTKATCGSTNLAWNGAR